MNLYRCDEALSSLYPVEMAVMVIIVCRVALSTSIVSFSIAKFYSSSAPKYVNRKEQLLKLTTTTTRSQGAHLTSFFRR